MEVSYYMPNIHYFLTTIEQGISNPLSQLSYLQFENLKLLMYLKKVSTSK